MPNVPAGSQMSIMQSLVDYLGFGAFCFPESLLVQRWNPNDTGALEITSECLRKTWVSSKSNSRVIHDLCGTLEAPCSSGVRSAFNSNPQPLKGVKLPSLFALPLFCLSKVLRSEWEKHNPWCLWVSTLYLHKAKGHQREQKIQINKPKLRGKTE